MRFLADPRRFCPRRCSCRYFSIRKPFHWLRHSALRRLVSLQNRRLRRPRQAGHRAAPFQRHVFESSIFVNASASITGVFGETVFDCSGRAGPAFVITGASVAITNVTFQHCANFGALNSMGGALSANLSSVTVVSCAFVNNSAQSGGAVGVTSSALSVSASLFQGNSRADRQPFLRQCGYRGAGCAE